MKYEKFPPLGSKTNQFLTYNPGESLDEYRYRHEAGIFLPVQGALPTDSFHGARIVLPPAEYDQFDACCDFDDYRRSNYRGRRRSHALQLAANHRNKSVAVFEKWLDPEQLESFKSIIDKLRAFCQGVRVTFGRSTNRQPTIYYQINKPIMEAICRELELVHKRTLQVNPDRSDDIPEHPLWSDTILPNIYDGVYNRNDWEILAATFRQECETFLLAMLYLGYDFKPVAPEDEDVEDDEPCQPFVPKKLDASVMSILEASMNYSSNQHVHFELDPAPVEQTSALGSITSHQSDDRPSHHSQGSPFRFPTSNLRESEVSKSIHSDRSAPQEPSLPRQTVLSYRPQDSPSQIKQMPSHTPATDPFAPLDPVASHTIVPNYQTEQVKRVYGAPDSRIDSYQPGTGTERFKDMFKPSRFSQPETIPVKSQQTQFSSPEIARATAHSLPSAQGPRSQSMFTLPTSEASALFNNAQSVTLPGISSILDHSNPFSVSGNPPDPIPPKGDGGPPSGRPPSDGPPLGRPPGDGPSGGGPPGGGPPGGGPPGGGPPYPSGWGAGEGNHGRNGMIQIGANRWVNPKEVHFDTKLKPDIIPTWDGDESTLGRWILQINELAQRSASVFQGLGDIVPSRFREKAASWWYSLTDQHRLSVTMNWDTLKDEIRTYWMNQAWIDRTQRKALRARYREQGHSSETPTEYYIRKYELLSFVYNFTPSQIMAEVLLKAPRLWSTVLNPRSFATLGQFQTAIKYHEDLLIELGERYDKGSQGSTQHRSRSYRVDAKSKYPAKKKDFKKSRSYEVRWKTQDQQPPHPKDDSTVSKGRTPESYGARGCIFCGSRKHWDRECKFNKGNGIRQARTMYIEYESREDELEGEDEYERCYEDSLSVDFGQNEESEESEEEEPYQEPQDFQETSMTH